MAAQDSLPAGFGSVKLEGRPVTRCFLASSGDGEVGKEVGVPGAV